MIGSDFGSQLEIGAEESRRQLGDQFLAGVAFVAPGLAAEIAGQTARVLSPVGAFMRQRVE